MNCVRDNNIKMFEKLGFDIGFDFFNDIEVVILFLRLLDLLNCEDVFFKIIIYSLNVNDNVIIGILFGCF